MKASQVCYLASYDPDSQPGVHNKVKQTVDALSIIGFKASQVVIKPQGIRGYLKMAFTLLTIQADIIIVRSTLYFLLLMPALIVQRCKRKKIIVDIPTPNAACVHEFILSNRWDRFIRVLFLYISFPFCLLPAHKIVQYAPESEYFSAGIKKKIQLHSNGINTALISARKKLPALHNDEFQIIGVGRLAPWHGFDRVIRGISDFCKTESHFIPRLILVGDGEISGDLSQLASDLGVRHLVEFAGLKTGKELDELFSLAHVAISGLALFRKNLDIASPLKSREYCARGIPFVSGCHDIDFNPKPAFVYQVKNDKTPINIDALIQWYRDLYCKEDLIEVMREYAEYKLDFKGKVKDILL